MLLLLLLVHCGLAASNDTDVVTKQLGAVGLEVSVPWSGTSLQDLRREYSNIFQHGNRNAASHLWSSFLLQRAAQMDEEKLVELFGGFCAVSGSPVQPNDYNRYKLTLPLASGAGTRTGYMHYCCWPCVCDTQDFIRVDTRTVHTATGQRQFHFAVIGNPCANATALDVEFVQPFGRRLTTLRREAPEVRCGAGGELLGATMSDHGHVIVSLFFDLAVDLDAEGGSAVAKNTGGPTPGRVTSVGGKSVQDEYEFGPQCSERAANGYNSGMGEIFRKVAAISPIVVVPKIHLGSHAVAAGDATCAS